MIIICGVGGVGWVNRECFDANDFAMVKKINCCASQSGKQHLSVLTI